MFWFFLQTRLVEIKAIPDLVCDGAEYPIFSWVNFLEDEGNFPLGYCMLYSPGHKRQHLLKSSRILECIEKKWCIFFHGDSLHNCCNFLHTHVAIDLDVVILFTDLWRKCLATGYINLKFIDWKARFLIVSKN